MVLKYGRMGGLTAVAIITAGCATVGAGGAKTITIENAWARRAPMMSQGGHGSPAGGGATGNGAVYAVIRNSGPHPDALLAATSSAARLVELHEVKSEGGVMAMRPIAKLPVPAGGVVEMKPGGYHIMLLGLTRDLKPGDTVPITLIFEKAGTVTIETPVR